MVIKAHNTLNGNQTHFFDFDFASTSQFDAVAICVFKYFPFRENQK